MPKRAATRRRPLAAGEQRYHRVVVDIWRVSLVVDEDGARLTHGVPQDYVAVARLGLLLQRLDAADLAWSTPMAATNLARSSAPPMPFISLHERR
jgi:hypothetical protein